MPRHLEAFARPRAHLCQKRDGILRGRFASDTTALWPGWHRVCACSTC